MTTLELLGLQSGVLSELRRRKVLRSSNSPAGDYGELLFSRAFSWSLEANSSSGHDATDKTGLRYQIKCRRLTPRNKSRQLSFMRNLPSKPFDVLAGVLLDENYLVFRAALVPFSVVNEKAAYSPHVKAWRLILRDSIWDIPGVRDVTAELKIAEATV